MNVEKRILGINRDSRRLNAVATACGTGAALLFIGQAVFLGEVVNRVFLDRQPRAAVLPLLGVMLLLLVGRAGLIGLAEIISQRAASHLKSDLRARLVDHLMQLGPVYTTGERSGELVSTAVSGVEILEKYVTQYLPARNLAFIVPFLVLSVIVLLDPWTALVPLFAGPMLLLILALIGGRTKEITERRFLELSWMSAFFLDLLQGLATLKLFGRSQEQSANIRELSRRYADTTMEVLRTAFQTSLVMEWAATAATAMVALEASLRLMNGALPFNRALAVLLLTPEFFLPLRQMALKYHAGTEGKAAASRIFEILDRPLNIEKTPTLSKICELGVPSRSLNHVGDIRLDNVYVAYDDGKRPALNGCSLTIPEGKIVALVGPTGAGKSTVASLLLRFLEPDKGTITVGGHPLSTIGVHEWRSKVAWLSQHPYLFHGSVLENLRLARSQATKREIIAAAQAAQAHEFIKGLPQGYDTQIGELGMRLSGGQRQRVAIARAYLKGAPLLIFDEATAHLDPENEALVGEALLRLAQGRTVLIIAHRLKLAYAADYVAVMASGRIVEQGQHQELVEDDLFYREMVRNYERSRT